MVLIVLVVLWGIVLIPPAWQSHAEARRARQADAFRRKLSVLAPGADTPLARRPMDAARPFEAARAHVAVMAPRNVVRLPVAEAEPVEYDTADLETVAAAAAVRRAERARERVQVLRRRQQVLAGLAVATPVTLVAAVVLGQFWAWALHGAVIVAFAAYLSALRRLRRLALERHTKVRYFPLPDAPAAPAAEAQDESRPARAVAR
ncbi:MAG TPA: hypothetical protein VEG38_11240 [Acidimicrobiia bacterium]|nr:hypothetical protein [Acidimicrobiia bacterium]